VSELSLYITYYKRKEDAYVNKQEFVTAMVEKTGMSVKDTEKALKAFEETITEELASGGKVQIIGFGTFDVTVRASYTGRNPQTGAALQIPESKNPRFKAGQRLKDAVSGK
jgi:DNA-binding protein HU-beta